MKSIWLLSAERDSLFKRLNFALNRRKFSESLVTLLFTLLMIVAYSMVLSLIRWKLFRGRFCVSLNFFESNKLGYFDSLFRRWMVEGSHEGVLHTFQLVHWSKLRVGLSYDLVYLNLLFALRVNHLNFLAKYFALDVGRLFLFQSSSVIDIEECFFRQLLAFVGKQRVASLSNHKTRILEMRSSSFNYMSFH